MRWGARHGRLAGATVLLAGMLAGCSAMRPVEGGARLLPRFFMETAGQGGLPVSLPQSGVSVAVNERPVLTEGDILDVELARVDLGLCLLFKLTPAASRDFYRLSTQHQGRRLVLTLAGRPVGARRLDGPLTDGLLFIFVEVPDEELAGLVGALKREVAGGRKEGSPKA